MVLKPILKDSSVKTILYALKFLFSVNDSILKISGSKVRKESAIRDIEKCEDAINDFVSFLRSLNNVESVENEK